MYPLCFEPIDRNYVWGKEAWLIADRPEAISRIANGPWKGKTLHDLLIEFGKDLLGKKEYPQFPLLIKIIDAKESLSVQVHPDERIAPLFQGEAKTEMWVALAPSTVYAGLKQGTTQQSLQEAMQNQTVEKHLQKLTLAIKEGVFIPAGTVHAICGGSLLLEVQQNSNTTYRLYDWGRTGRPLHIKEAFASIHWEDPRPSKILSHSRTLASSPYFSIERLILSGPISIPQNRKTFRIFFCEKGEGALGKELLFPRAIYLLPAAMPPVSFEGECQLLQIY